MFKELHGQSHADRRTVSQAVAFFAEQMTDTEKFKCSKCQLFRRLLHNLGQHTDYLNDYIFNIKPIILQNNTKVIIFGPLKQTKNKTKLIKAYTIIECSSEYNRPFRTQCTLI